MVEEYLLKRSISKETMDYADIKQDQHGNITFEHRDVDGKLLCTKYRPSRRIKKGEDKAFLASGGKYMSDSLRSK